MSMRHWSGMPAAITTHSLDLHRDCHIHIQFPDKTSFRFCAGLRMRLHGQRWSHRFRAGKRLRGQMQAIRQESLETAV